MRVAALFVEESGVYANRAGVDAWHAGRDARRYPGPYPVVAHPPCKRWGRYWSGGPSTKVRRLKGDDGNCFATALHSVRLWGGVLEHPAASHAWTWNGLLRPPHTGGWVRADHHGWTCHVEQIHYGHVARKATWLYAVQCELPSLRWGPAPVGSGRRLDEGFHSKYERATVDERRERLGKVERLGTPEPFAEMLLEMARSVHPLAEVAKLPGAGLKVVK